MLDDLHRGPEGGHRRAGARENGSKPLADREVPLVRQAGTMSPAMHAWLDGDLPEAAVRKAEASRDIEFWQRLTSELDERRHMRTPAFLEAQIMNALPSGTPVAITPWWRRELVLSPVALLGGATALVALTAAATAAVTKF